MGCKQLGLGWRGRYSGKVSMQDSCGGSVSIPHRHMSVSLLPASIAALLLVACSPHLLSCLIKALPSRQISTGVGKHTAYAWLHNKSIRGTGI